MTDDFGALRDRLVDQLRDAGYIRTEQVAEAFRAVPRHVFLPGVDPAKVYVDDAIVTKHGPDGRPISSSSQPAIMAMMLEQLAVEPGHQVLEIGAGTGYNAGLLAHLAGETGSVTTLDIDADLVAGARQRLQAAGLPRVQVVCADGAGGWPQDAPYERIILTVGADDLAPAWLDQLAAGGRLVLPLSLRGAQRSVAFEPAGDHFASVSIVDCGFMPLRGALARPDLIRPLGGEPGMFLRLGRERELEPDALVAALRWPGEIVNTGVRARPPEIMRGLALWLPLREPDIAYLTVLDAAAGRGLVPTLVELAGMALTVVVLGDRAAAALVPADQAGAAADWFELGVQSFGPDAGELVRRLVGHVRDWEEAGRPSTAGLRIEAYRRSGAVRREGRFVIDTLHARLLLDWQPMP